MVLPTKVGKQRSFGRGLLFTILSFGIYSIYWNYKAHNEVFEQFELKKETRDEGIVWFIVGIFIGPLLWVFQYKAVENVNYARERMGMQKGVGPLEFILWSTIGILLFFIGPFIAYAKYQRTINELWDRYDQRKVELVAQGATPPAPKPMM